MAAKPAINPAIRSRIERSDDVSGGEIPRGHLGAAVSGRHVWLQGLPADQVPECGPGLAYMLNTFPLSRAIRETLTGSGECASVDWIFLGLSMPGWALLWFIGLGLLVLAAGLGNGRRAA